MSRAHPDVIYESPALLSQLLEAERRQPALYRPGPYWRSKTESAVNQIRRYGLSGFRGDESGLGTSFADNLYVDVRSALDTRRGRPIKFILERVWPFAPVFASQVALTRGYARDEVALLAARMSESEITRDLLSRYEVKNSLVGGCVAAARIGDHEHSLHHLRTLQQIDHVRRHVNLEGVRAMFEIGGGFGALVQLLLDNFANLRKVVYLDVVPNLYVGTCYLRTLLGDAVRDFSETGSLTRLAFRDDDEREILAIAPWQIEQLELSIDLFWNANSFVEMPREVVTNYARHVLRLGQPDAAAIVLATYGGGGPDTLPPEELPAVFPGRQFARDRYHALDHPADHRLDPDRDASWETFLFVSPGQHGVAVPSSPAAAQTSAPG